MKKILIVFLLLGMTAINAQDVVMTVNNQPVTTAEFERMYTKNLDLVQDKEQKDIDNYLQLFSNYKLELADAYAKKYDTLPQFSKELKSYRRDLAKKYLSDEDLMDDLIKEAYERKKTDVRVAHILIQVGANAEPKDTLKAYNKIYDIYKKALKTNDFSALAVQYSQDPSVRSNKGDLDYINIFNTVYPFETAAYTTPVGKISKPFRTRFGYHILKVIDKRPARGELEVAHIMAMDKKDSKEHGNAETRINEIYHKLVDEKANFSELAKKFSDDKSTSKYGGKLRRFGIREMIPAFEDIAFSLKNEGDISKPFKTKYGWHIVKLIKKYPLPSFDKYRKTLKYKVMRDGRSKLGKEKLMKRVEKQFAVKMNGSLNKVYPYITQDFFANKWKIPNAGINQQTLFTIDGKKQIKYDDFLKYLYRRQLKNSSRYSSKSIIIDNLFKQFKKEQLFAYYDENLEKIYPDFAAIMQEYKDGLLMFYIKSDMVWEKASKDTIGLQKYFDTHKKDFVLPKRYEILLVQAGQKKTAKKVAKALRKVKDSKYLKNAFENAKLIIKEKIYKASDKFVKEHKLEKNKVLSYKDNGVYYVIKLQRVIPQEEAPLDKVKGAVTNAYQKYLESEWLKELKSKYPIKINEANWQKIRAKYKK